MPNEVVEANAGASEKPVEAAKKPTRLSPDEFAAHRAKAFVKAPKADPKVETPKAKSEPPPEDGKGKAKADPDVLSKAKPDKGEDLEHIEIEGLSEEEKAVLSKARSKLLVRVGELTAKRKTAEEELVRMRAEVESKAQASRVAPVANNPYLSIKDEAALEAEAEKITGTIDWIEGELDKATDLRGDDIVTEVEGRSYTKLQLRELKRNAIAARDKFLPDIRQRFADRKKAIHLRDTAQQLARRELSWLENKEDQRSKVVEQTLADPAFKRLEETEPDLAARLSYIIPHAANSMYGRREIPLEELDEKKLTEDPPENPSAAAGGTRGDGQGRQLKELESRFRQTGKRGDFENLRASHYARKLNRS